MGVDIEGLKSTNAKQVSQFERFAARGQIEKFHASHYDWWAFPINESSSYGLKYTIEKEDVAKLQADDVFMMNFRKGVKLVAWAWGYDVEKRVPVENPLQGQQWTHYPVRLYKMGRSCQLLGETELFESLLQFAEGLEKQKENLSFHSTGRRGMLHVLKGWETPLW
eukprot:Phypoly_transcript_19086.p1 GENE.Phypoly_transcript_19086~~Phypoly_transcript_19086.p1  ORF type:complete len:166 (+),score=26.46 Phypoly_transcript_19086:197-694(+)